MAKFDEPIRNLIYSSKAHTEENRAHIFRHVVQLLSAPDLPENDDERILLLEVFDRLAPHVDTGARLEAARTVANSPSPSMALAERLACDAAKVAAPVLKKVPFDEDALLRIIARTGKAHHLLIAEKADLTQRVWEALSNERRSASSLASQGGHPADEMMPAADVAAGDASGPRSSLRFSEPRGTSRVPRDEISAVAGPATPGPGVRNEGFHDTPPRPGPSGTDNPYPEFESRRRLVTPDQGFTWSTDREGMISDISAGAEQAFGRPAAALRGSHFFAAVTAAKSSPGTAALGHILTRHLPIRDFAVDIEGRRGQKRTWILTAHARFDRAQGHFQGYEGTARPRDALPADERTGKQDVQKRPGGTTFDDRLLGSLFREALAPTHDALAAASHLAARARENEDRGSLTDLSIILEAGHRLRSMMEDLLAFHEMNGGLRIERRANFSARAALAECLEEDADRHGGLSRFRLRDDAADGHLFFDRDLFSSTILRMFEVARRKGAYLKNPSLGLAFESTDQLRISVPMGEVEPRLEADELLFSPIDYIKTLSSPVISKAGLVFTPEFGLSVMRQRVRAFGGDITLRSKPDGEYDLCLTVPISA